MERLVYRLCGIDPEAEMDWRRYASSLLAFSFVGMLAVYAIQRLQGLAPFNPEGLRRYRPTRHSIPP